MKIIAFLDVETTGTDHEKDLLLEVACILWSVPLRSTIVARSWIVDAGCTENPAQAINGIDPALVRAHGSSRAEVLASLVTFSGGADALVAWNADFDSRWLPPSIIPWICAMDDLSYPRGGSGKSCTAVALAHGVGVVDAHRAMTDCMTMARLFERVAEMHDADRHKVIAPAYATTFEQWLIHGLRPKAVFTNADRSYNPKANDAYKAHGFRWHLTQPCSTIPAGEKVWWRRMAVEDAKALPFAVREVRP